VALLVWPCWCGLGVVVLFGLVWTFWQFGLRDFIPRENRIPLEEYFSIPSTEDSSLRNLMDEVFAFSQSTVTTILLHLS
jgi:hypothetical protein